MSVSQGRMLLHEQRSIAMQPILPAPDGTLILDTQAPQADAAALLLVRCAELVEAPGRLHTYRLTLLSLWQAAAAGEQAESLIAQLAQLSRTALPARLERLIADACGRYGRLWIEQQAGQLVLCADQAQLLERLAANTQVAACLGQRLDERRASVSPAARGMLKAALARAGYPAEDRAPLLPGARLELRLRHQRLAGGPFALRPYQQCAVRGFLEHGSGVVVLPCGAGKTAVGLGVLAELQVRTLVLCPSASALSQWRAELLDKTSLSPAAIGEWSGERKLIGPLTLATYQVLARRSGGVYEHFARLGAEDWGLVIYDEVHLLPAPVFRMAADLQARRRLGLTATLVREDGRERDVFSLIGPQRFARPWRELEHQGWIAPARCAEVRVPLPEAERLAYAMAEDLHSQARIAAENPGKQAVVEQLLTLHPGERALVIGQYLAQLEQLAARLKAPLLSGRTPQRERERLYAEFRAGRLPLLIVSKVANVAIDLPDATLAIQISGAFGSRQEEAQRLGRLLRPKRDGQQAHFYTLVSADTREELDAARRQRFLVEQGYRYAIIPAGQLRAG